MPCEWHNRIQNLFENKEIDFRCNNKHQIRDRRADVVIEEQQIIIEIQHSEIDSENVNGRCNDYGQHKYKIIWFIDGNTSDIKLEQLTDGNYLIIFDNSWKYKSFTYNYDFVLLDIENKIFKIPVKKVCNKMILLKEWKPIDFVVEKLKTNPNNIWNEWEDDNEIKATLTVHQKGAGNGKTFGIWKNISENMNKDLFIVVTKQHAAKSVIRKELDDQAERNEFHIVDNIEKFEEDVNNKKYIIEYKHNHSNRSCTVIIATIDSFIYNVCSKQNSNSDHFEGLLESLKESGATKVNKHTGSFYFAGKSLQLNKKTELWIDEAQDLNRLYFEGVVKLMWETKIDVVIVGDKLQSLEYKINFMTCVEDMIPNINIIGKEVKINENRRIQVEGMAEETNRLIHFSDYQLPEIKPKNQLKHENEPLEVLDSPCIYAGDRDNKKIEEYIDLIIEKVEIEVNEHNYKPEDFLFVFPIMKNNVLAVELETKLHEYWIKKYNCDDYKQYAILHQHEDGQVIDTKRSEKASRIVTIRTSKGDGRNVVFVLGVTEASLKLLSRNDKIDLLFESYLHVALTRAKRKIYFGLQKNNDKIHKRFGENGLVEYEPIINSNISHDKIIQNINNNKIIDLLKRNGIIDKQKEENKKTNSNETIDWGFHCIRRSIYLQYARFNIFNETQNNNFTGSQLKKVLDDISKLPVKRYLPKKFFNYIRIVKDFSEGTNLLPACMPLCDLSHKGEYKKITRKIEKIIENNKKNYKKNNLSIGNQTPLEAIIQQYCIELYTRGQYIQTSHLTIYNIVNHYENQEETKITKLMDEAKIIKDINARVMKQILKNDKVDWNIEHMLKLHGNSSEFEIWNRDIPIIGWDDSTVYHFIFQSDFNELNYWDTIIKICIERFIIYNPGDKGKDIAKFKDKSIKTYLFILKQNNFELFDWEFDNDSEFNNELKLYIKEAIVSHFSSFNTGLYQYCQYIKKDTKWKENFRSPYDFIANNYNEKFKPVVYVRDFFKQLHELSKTNRKEVKRITDDYDIFTKKLTEKIEDMCDTFFGLNTVEENEEW